MPRTVEDWQQIVISRLPPVDQVLARNFALTAQYAQWYKAFPRIFKWAGMASFSSHRVGIALAPYQLEVIAENVQRLEEATIPPRLTDTLQIVDIRNPDISLARKSEVLPGLNLLRETNNAVFKDIGWAHEAYVTAGLQAVEDAIGADKTYEKLKTGFQQIDRGMHLDETGQSAEAEKAIWDGNMALLNHEQYDVIQPLLKQATVLFDDFLSAATVMAYFVNPFQIHLRKMTVFPLAMLFFGLPGLLAKRSLPDFTDIDQRWFWITQRVVPIFQQLDGGDPLNAGIEEIIAAGSQNFPVQ